MRTMLIKEVVMKKIIITVLCTSYMAFASEEQFREFCINSGKNDNEIFHSLHPFFDTNFSWENAALLHGEDEIVHKIAFLKQYAEAMTAMHKILAGEVSKSMVLREYVTGERQQLQPISFRLEDYQYSYFQHRHYHDIAATFYVLKFYDYVRAHKSGITKDWKIFKQIYNTKITHTAEAQAILDYIYGFCGNQVAKEEQKEFHTGGKVSELSNFSKKSTSKRALSGAKLYFDPRQGNKASDFEGLGYDEVIAMDLGRVCLDDKSCDKDNNNNNNQ